MSDNPVINKPQTISDYHGGGYFFKLKNIQRKQRDVENFDGKGQKNDYFDAFSSTNAKFYWEKSR